MRSHPLATIAAAAVAACLAAAAAPASAETTTTYALPAGVTAGSGLTSDASGNVWFSTGDANAQSTPRIGRFVPSQGVADTDAGITLWPTPTYVGAPCCATQVRALDFDDDNGRIWFVRSDGMYGYGNASVLAAGGGSPFSTNVQPNKIGLWGVAYDPASKRTFIAEHSASNAESPAGSHYFPGNRMASTDGGLGLNESKNIAQQNDETSLVSLRYDAKPRGAAPDGKGEAWFVESDPGNPGYRIGHTKGSGYDEYLITPCLGVSPCSGSFTGTGPTDVTVGKDGAVWFTNQINNSVGRLDPGALTFTSYSIATFGAGLSGGKPFAIRAAADGSIWLAEYGGPFVNQSANAIIKIAPGGGATPTTATVYKTGNDGPLTVEPTANGDVYYLLNTASAPGKLGRLSFGTTTTPPAGGGETPGGGTPGGEAPGGGTAAPPASTAPVVIKPATVGQAKISPPVGNDVNVRQICVGPPQDKCSLVYLLDSHDYVTGFPGTKESLTLGAPKKPKKPKTVELGRTEVTLSGGETRDIKVSLSKKAKTLLKKKKKLKVTLRIMEKQPDGTLNKVSSKEITFKAEKPKKK